MKESEKKKSTGRDKDRFFGSPPQKYGNFIVLKASVIHLMYCSGIFESYQRFCNSWGEHFTFRVKRGKNVYEDLLEKTTSYLYLKSLSIKQNSVKKTKHEIEGEIKILIKKKIELKFMKLNKGRKYRAKECNIVDY